MIIDILYDIKDQEAIQPLRFCQSLFAMWILEMWTDVMSWEYKLLDPFHKWDEKTLQTLVQFLIDRNIPLSDKVSKKLSKLIDSSPLGKTISNYLHQPIHS